MKTCPQCRAQYDDYMRFCLQDGNPLVAVGVESSTEDVTESFDFPQGTNPPHTETVTEEWTEQNALQETFVETNENQASPTNQVTATQTSVHSEPEKSRAGIFIGALLLSGLLLLGSAIGGIFWYLSNQKTNELVSVNTNQVNPVNSNISEENPNFEVSNANLSDAVNLPPGNTNLTIKTSPTPTPKPTATPKPDESKTPDKTPTPEYKPTPLPKPPIDVPNPTPGKPLRPIAGGVVNGKAISLPKPNYPAAAKAIGAKGAVNVQILIDEDGNVSRARAVSGHPLLRSAAESAARGAKFRPTQLSGQTVKVSGVIVYVFN